MRLTKEEMALTHLALTKLLVDPNRREILSTKGIDTAENLMDKLLVELKK